VSFYADCQYPNATFNLVPVLLKSYFISNVVVCTKFLHSFLNGISGDIRWQIRKTYAGV